MTENTINNRPEHDTTYGCQVHHIFLFLYLNVAKESSVSA